MRYEQLSWLPRPADRPLEFHTFACLGRYAEVKGYRRMPARLMDPFVCICKATRR